MSSVRLSELDKEIRQLEMRIADDRAAFKSALSECGHSARETMSSPKALAAVAAVGFIAGKLMFGSGKSRPARAQQPAPEPSKAGGLLGLLAAGLSLMQPGYGPGGIARWAAQQYWERRKQKQHAARTDVTVPRGAPTGEMPQVRMPARSARMRPAAAAGRE